MVSLAEIHNTEYQILAHFFQINLSLLLRPIERFPFQWNNPIGYFTAVTLEYAVICYELFISACNLAFAFGITSFVISTTKEIQRILHSINKDGHANKYQSTEIMDLFGEYIDSHGILKQLSF